MRNLLLSLCVSLLFQACSQCPAQKNTPVLKERWVLIGVDGLDPERVQRLMQQGRLPHMAALSQHTQGVVKLASTQPPQSPVAWSTFATGLLPGFHGVFDFVDRDPSTYQVRMATSDVAWPHVYQKRKGEAFWDVLAAHNIPVTVLQVPYAYPLGHGGVALAGLGLPDARGTVSSFTWFTTEPFQPSPRFLAGGQKVSLERIAQTLWQGVMKGPLGVESLVRFETTTTGLRMLLQGQTHVLQAGRTSPYVVWFFNTDEGAQVWVSSRFTYTPQANGFEVYAEPLGVWPEKPHSQMSQPPSFAQTLWKKHQGFKAVGWQDDTSALEAQAITEAQFIQESYEHMAFTQSVLLDTLRTQKKGLVVAVFTSLDRIGHMFAKEIFTPKHAFADVLDEHYIRIDNYLGQVAQELSEKDTYMVLSDHGFGTFTRQFHLNRWLIDRGYMVLKKNATEPGTSFDHVDWSRTQAYALGTASVYLNKQGRERDGVVPAEEVPSLVNRLVQELEHVQDGDVLPVLHAYKGDAVFAGTERFQAPDVHLALRKGYRLSWETSLGGAGKTWFEDNTHHWSGDHAGADAKDVPGVLLCNRVLSVPDPHLQDIATTVLKHFGQEKHPHAKGRVLFKNR